MVGPETALHRNPERLQRRTVGEWTFDAPDAVPVAGSPFADVRLDATFTAPSGALFVMPGFYDGDGVWRVRFNPDEVGRWTYHTRSVPTRPVLERSGAFEVTANEAPGFLKATPGTAWGFSREDGSPVFVFGDTTYHLFGMAHCGADVQSFLERRSAQGFNLLRVRIPVSPFHPPDGYSDWQTRRTWPWGGSEQAPRFDRFDLDYFRTVDAVVLAAEELGIGLELIMEGWGFEFPFNSRQIFTQVWEELWLRYLIARYDAFNATWIWTPLNEYEYYPNGDWHYKPVADRWQLRTARWIKATAPHGHVVAAHNGPRLPPFAERFAADPEAVDAILFQEWGTRGEADGWLAADIEEVIDAALAGWQGSAVFAEWGYERNPALPRKLPSHDFCDRDHTRRGAWRGAFRGLGIIHGFENSWGPWQVLDADQPGLDDLLHVRRFFTEVVPFAELRPQPGIAAASEGGMGRDVSALMTANGDVVAVYLPVGGEVTVDVAGERDVRWFDPRSGELQSASAVEDGRTFSAPVGGDARPWDWVLVSAVPGRLLT